MSDSREVRRLQRIWSTMIAAVIVVVAWLQRQGPVHVSLRALAWLFALWLFLLVVWIVTAERRYSRRLTLALAAGQSALVLLMVPIAPAHAEGGLLSIVAFVIARQLSIRAGLLWIGVQSVLVAVVGSIRWDPHQAGAIAAMSVPFQVLALYTGRVVRGEILAREDLARSNAELRATQNLLADSNRAAERFRISRELHDVFGHRLTALSLNLEIATVAPEGERAQSVSRAYAITRELLGEIRDVVENLREGAHIDLARALETLTAEVPRPRVHLEIPPRMVIDSGQQAHVLLRCAQEVVTNAMKHSDARHLWLRFDDSSGVVEMTAHDDGRGATSLKRGHGLRGLEERLREVGGSLEAGNAPDGGFRVRVVVPVIAP